MKIQEIAFVLVALVLLFSMVFVFYIKLQSGGIEKKAAELRQEKALSLLNKVIAMPELKCSGSFGSDSLCIDKDKLDIMTRAEYRDKYENLFSGTDEVRIKEIYPESGKEYVIYYGEKEEYSEYSAFTRLCREKYNGISWQECSIGVIIVSV